ncbi:nucleotidyltransferase domain-containing protein [Haliovirga abyssi]|uniref:cGAS/DncV-like nucleotidyltransferase C-terminal helical domain-containing protein n=1 Tax=Haliovirga abyssi TaxID=2996794 RepID=A0AAU9DHL3_9FUSO|nr:nucleotidyltransferase [Haliovirga abyssi]BDU51037.1 hypothetical protein HLVA_16060 [Haliovirga abyssi]
MKFDEELLKKFALPLSQTEDEKCKNAIKMVRDAMKLSGYLDNSEVIKKYSEDTFSYTLDMNTSDYSKKLRILIQGSYANNTNIRSHSDVDVAVILESTFIPEYRAGITGEKYFFTDGTYSAKELKDDVERALNLKFNNQGVIRNDKSLKVIGNSYRVDADVVPAYRLRNYKDDYNFDSSNYIGGIEIRPDSGGRIRNYPEQHIINGKEKNNKTNYYFKKHVRILKKIRNLMKEDGYKSVEQVSSFGLESLLWNLPNDLFSKYSLLKYTFDDILIYLNNNNFMLGTFKEVNGIKVLFSNEEMVNKYKKFIKEINEYFEIEI